MSSINLSQKLSDLTPSPVSESPPHMTEPPPITARQTSFVNSPAISRTQVMLRRHFLGFLSVFTFGFSFLMPDVDSLASDTYRILTSQTYLMHDFFEVGGIAATFFNSAIHLLMAYLIKIHKEFKKLTGLQMAAIGIFAGHSYFGTHVLNIAPIILGVWLFTRFNKRNFSEYTAQCLLATSTGPIVSFLMFSNGLHFRTILLAMLVGVIMGFIAIPLAEHFIGFHKGFTLYNYGLTAGIIAMFVVLSFPILGYEVTVASYISTHAHDYIVVYLIVLLLMLAGLSSLSEGKLWGAFNELLKNSGRSPADFVLRYGERATLFNMAVNGTILLIILLMTGYPLNGAVIGGVLSVIGFSAYGKHPRNSVPVIIGVVLATWLSGGTFHSLTFMLPLLFGTTLAPISGHYGWVFGVLAGILQYHLVNSVMLLHLGMNLYNNGFASGFVAAFMVPLIDMLPDSLIRTKLSSKPLE